MHQHFLKAILGIGMQKLPIDSILDEFLAAFPNNDVFIVHATPGAGKTTRIAPAVLKKGLLKKDKKILMLQPRRIAAKATAARIAEENNWSLGGKEIGYHVRFEKVFTGETQLLIMTEGVLSRRLIDDPELKNVDCVILDEFHERSIHSDLSLALLKELKQIRSDLKIIVMSATLEGESLKGYFPQALSFKAEGQVFPLHVIHQAKADRRDRIKRLEEQVADAVSYLTTKEDDQGNILVFLPGVGEIRRVHDLLLEKKYNSSFEILELHGSLSLQEQSKVLKLGNRRRIILSTNVAETSLTVPGVSAVVDSGLLRIARWDTARNNQTLEVSRVSLASATQRAGRAAREKAGRVYKLWSQEEEHGFKPFEEAEIHRVDLSSALLILATWGIRDFDSFAWFEKPSSTKIKAALEHLKSLGAMDKSCRITDLGKKIQRIPLEPRMALALLSATEHGKEVDVSLALALMSEKDPFLKGAFHFGSMNHECDFSSKIEALKHYEEGQRVSGLNEIMAKRILNVARDLRGAVSEKSSGNKKELGLPELLWSAYSDRLCRRREAASSRALMVGGRGVLLDESSELRKTEFFLALDIFDSGTKNETRVSRGTSITLAQIKNLGAHEVKTKIEASLDFKNFKLKAIKGVFYRDLILEGPYPAELKSNDLEDSLLESLLKQWDAFILRFADLKDVERRIQYVNKFCPELEVPSFDDEFKKALFVAAFEHSKSASVDTFDVLSVLPSFYPRAAWDKLNRVAPATLLVPSGRHIALTYSDSFEDVKCSVKLQELFGWATSPTILNSKVQIVFDLLSPAQRPVQTTKDLASFWKNAYPALRSQLKIKYPKHPWPEDPWTAQATHKTKRALLK